MSQVEEAVRDERPDLRQAAAPDGTVTILFTDIEDSTGWNERLGDERWISVLRSHNRAIREQVRAHAGFEVKSQGDGFMLAFPSARRALRCAVETQRALAESPLLVRAGLHTGEAIRDRDDFFGRSVVLASRIAGQAKGAEILASTLVRELVSGAEEFAFGDGREVELKGLSGTHIVYPVEWQQ